VGGLVRLESWGRKVLRPSEGPGAVLLACPAEARRKEGGEDWS